jgi:hypothetical protein
MSGVRLTVVPDEGEADIICGLLRANGIKSSHRGTLLTEGIWPVGSTSPIEVMVDESDLARARKVLKQKSR